MEILMNKAKCYREPASLNHNLYFNQKSRHNPLPQTRNQSWAWQYLLRKAVFCVGQLCVGIACVQKIALKEVVLKWSPWTTWASCQGPEWKLQLLLVDSIIDIFRYHFWASEELGLFEYLDYAGPMFGL